MRILFVAMADSPHTAGSVRLLDETGWEILLLAPYRAEPLPGLPQRRITPYSKESSGFVSVLPGALSRAGELAMAVTPLKRTWRRRLLQLTIERLRPDIVHSLEFQHCGYLCLEARDHLARFPTWIATNWGSDIARFGEDPRHADRIDRLLASIDAYGAECARDVALARARGCRAPALPLVPNNGGFDLNEAEVLRSGPPSRRRLVMVKGYQHFAGRALTVVRALGRCRQHLRGYTVRVYSASPPVVRAVDEVRHQLGIDIECLDRVPQVEMLRQHGAARVSISVGVTDGISTSMLEAMVMGSYPVQSRGACADEWIEHGRSGSVVDVDEDEIAEAIVRALTSDSLVDAAAQLNWKTASERLDRKLIRPRVIKAYETAARASRAH